MSFRTAGRNLSSDKAINTPVSFARRFLTLSITHFCKISNGAVQNDIFLLSLKNMGYTDKKFKRYNMIEIISSAKRDKLSLLRKKLSIQEGLVTKSSSKLTEEVFGEPLTPIEVVRTILQDVKEKKDEGKKEVIYIFSMTSL